MPALLAVRGQRCRFCHLVLSEHADEPPAGGDQLWITGPTALQLWTAHPGAYDTSVGRPPPAAKRAAERHAAARSTSPHLIDPNQLPLFDRPVRDWTRLDRTALPALAPEAHTLLAALDQYATRHAWEPAITDFNRRTLRILLSWLGATAPVHETDVKAVGALGPNLGARRTIQFLAAHNMLIPDPAALLDPDQQAIEQQIAVLPDQLAREASLWISVLRGQRQTPLTRHELGRHPPLLPLRAPGDLPVERADRQLALHHHR